MPYLEGLRAANADPNLSVAVEARSGIKSASSSIAAGGGMRTSPSHADMIEAGAIMTAKTFDDPELIKWIAMRVNW